VEQGNDRARWERTAREKPRWDERNQLIASYIPPGSTVVDLGCGAQTLRDHLPEGCRYLPVDLVPAPGVVVCDFNAGEFPELGERADLAVCSGVLEYLAAPLEFLARLPELARRVLLSYADLGDDETQATRERRGWVNHLTESELHAIVETAGLHSRELGAWTSHAVYVLEPLEAANLPPLREPSTMTFADGLPALWKFIAREAHTDVGASHLEDGFPLGAWVAEQRRSYARRRLSRDEIERLEATPDWAWTQEEAQWLHGFRLIETHPSGEPLTPGLRGWTSAQRVLRAEGGLPAERQRRLEALPGWAWSAEDAWMHGYELVRAHPVGEPVPPGLKGWIDAQKLLHAEGDLPADRARRLEALPGWRWGGKRPS
jgi:hypothetical protein